MKKSRYVMSVATLVTGTFVASRAAQAAETTVTDVMGISTALCESQSVISGEARPPLVGVSDAQKKFLPLVPKYCAQSFGLTDDELKVFASFNEKEINDKLVAAGSRLRVEFDKIGDAQFGVVSVIKVQAEWLVPGITSLKDNKTGVETPITLKGRPAFKMSVGAHAIKLLGSYRLRDDAEPVIVLEAKNGDKLILWRTDDRPEDVVDKERVATSLTHAATFLPENKFFTGAIMTMASVDREIDISWLVGLKYGGTDWFVSQAKQQVRYDFDPERARVETETVIVNKSRSMTPRNTTYELDGSHYAVLVRPGMTVPYFSAFIGEEDLKAPQRWLDRQAKKKRGKLMK